MCQTDIAQHNKLLHGETFWWKVASSQFTLKSAPQKVRVSNALCIKGEIRWIGKHSNVPSRKIARPIGFAPLAVRECSESRTTRSTPRKSHIPEITIMISGSRSGSNTFTHASSSVQTINAPRWLPLQEQVLLTGAFRRTFTVFPNRSTEISSSQNISPHLSGSSTLRRSAPKKLQNQLKNHSGWCFHPQAQLRILSEWP